MDDSSGDDMLTEPDLRREQFPHSLNVILMSRKPVQVPLHSPFKKGPEKSHAMFSRAILITTYSLEHLFVTLSDDYVRHALRSKGASGHPPSMK